MSLDLAMKRCPGCDQELPLSAFTPSAQQRSGAACRECQNKRARRYTANRIARIGPVAERERIRRHVQTHRDRTNYAYVRRYDSQRRAAIQALIEAHRGEFDHLMLLSKRGEL